MKTKIVFGVIMLAVIALLVVQALTPATRPAPTRTPLYGFRVIHTYPHDREAFTQGLIFRDGFLYESTGLNGRSSLRKVNLETGKAELQISVDARYFAEGLTDWQSRLVQLTWQNEIGFLYDLASFQTQGTFSYSGEGWGLTHDDRQLILSDGSDRLRFLDPQTFRETGQVQVVDNGLPVRELNELEFVKGAVYANVWHTDRIVMIAPESGKVTGWIDLAGLLDKSEQPDPEAVLNGIAYDPATERLFVTGKLWPKLYEIKLVSKP
jgi:glutaminyl-peptide cyclotransferase